MQLKTLFATALLASATGLATPAPPPPTTFPADIQTSIVTIQGYIQNVIRLFATNGPNKATEYSSTGRSLDFFLRETFLPGGPTQCPQALEGRPLPPQATTSEQAIQYMQRAQLALIAVSQDAVNNDFAQAIVDICRAVRQYGGAAISS